MSLWRTIIFVLYSKSYIFTVIPASLICQPRFFYFDVCMFCCLICQPRCFYFDVCLFCCMVMLHAYDNAWQCPFSCWVIVLLHTALTACTWNCDNTHRNLFFRMWCFFLISWSVKLFESISRSVFHNHCSLSRYCGLCFITTVAWVDIAVCVS